MLVVVYTAQDEVLALCRCQPADFWQSVTGSLNWDEVDPLDTARRELLEETGLGEGLKIVNCGLVNRFPILPAWRQRYAPDVRENIEHVFRVCLPERATITLNPEEHRDYLWLPRVAAAARMTSWTNRDAVLALPVPHRDPADS
ncbi:MAG: dihydroneopterin triphosphate diphosphatase [Pseudomonadota bacterium]|nr:dihydroneopterin triphosphate diphosphatase [Pseudomonadota bacterium]